MSGVLYVTSTRDAIHRFRAATGASLGLLTKGAPLQGPRSMMLIGDSIAVASHQSGYVLRYDINNAWKCPLSKSPCATPYSFSGKKLSSLTSLALGAESVYIVGPHLGAIYRLNATTGEYIEHYQYRPLTAAAPLGITYFQGHVFVATAGTIYRYNALTGESYGRFVKEFLSRPNQMLWH